ncbi:MAG: hypothetical protein ACOC9Y_06715 [Chloroflexota bacterium]
MMEPGYPQTNERYNKTVREDWLSRGGKISARKIRLWHIAVLIGIVAVIAVIYFMSGSASASVAQHTDAQGNDVYFAQWNVGNVEGGPVFLDEIAIDDDGCIRIGDDEGPVIVWPAEYSIEPDRDAPVIYTREDHDDLAAREGTTSHFRGENRDEVSAADQLPEDCREGPFFFASEVNDGRGNP